MMEKKVEQTKKKASEKIRESGDLSCRTQQLKQYEIEKWVTVKNEEINTVKQSMMDIKKKTENMFKETMMNSESMKVIFADSRSARSGAKSARARLSN